MRVLSRDEFAAYAETQIEMANQILAGHRVTVDGWCSCGRQLPCAVTAHVVTTRDRYLSQLALLDATQVLPVLAPPVPARPVPWWRRLLGGPR